MELKPNTHTEQQTLSKDVHVPTTSVLLVDRGWNKANITYLHKQLDKHLLEEFQRQNQSAKLILQIKRFYIKYECDFGMLHSVFNIDVLSVVVRYGVWEPTHKQHMSL